MSINYEHYRIFYYVAKHKSFTQAANVLVNSQPNITRSIKNLEQELGCTLFFRSNRQVQLTPEGEELFAHIAPAIEQIRIGEEKIMLHSSLQSGHISIGVSEIALHHILLPVLEEFRQEHPGIHLRIFNSNTTQAIKSLKERKVDFALVTLPIERTDLFCTTKLATFQEVPIGGNIYKNLKDISISPEQLAFFPMISLCRGTSTHRLYSDWFASYGLSFSPEIEAATADQILPMVRANLGIGFVPEHTAREAAAAGDILILNLQETPPTRSICLVKRKDSPLSMAACKLEEMILCHSPIITKDGETNG